MSLKRSRRITISLKATHLLSGTLCNLLQDNGQVEIHHAVDEEQICGTRPCGQATVGDEGYTEAYTDSEKEQYGKGLLGTSSPRRATTARLRDGTGPASVDCSLCNCTMVAIGIIGIGCEETTIHSPSLGPVLCTPTTAPTRILNVPGSSPCGPEAFCPWNDITHSMKSRNMAG